MEHFRIVGHLSIVKPEILDPTLQLTSYRQQLMPFFHCTVAYYNIFQGFVELLRIPIAALFYGNGIVALVKGAILDQDVLALFNIAL
jgi:hypothetical protein